MRNLHRSLRRYEHALVVISLDTKDGVRGHIKHVWRDAVVLINSQGMAAGPDGTVLKEPVQSGERVIPRDRIVQILTVSE